MKINHFYSPVWYSSPPQPVIHFHEFPTQNGICLLIKNISPMHFLSNLKSRSKCMKIDRFNNFHILNAWQTIEKWSNCSIHLITHALFIPSTYHKLEKEQQHLKLDEIRNFEFIYLLWTEKLINDKINQTVKKKKQHKPTLTFQCPWTF